jgi:hypothetical protein
MYMTPTRPDPIWLARRMRWASPPESVSALRSECQVVESDVHQEAEAVGDLLDDLGRDLLAPALEHEDVEELQRTADGRGADRGQRRAADEDESRRFREACAIAFGAAARAG